MIRSYVGALVAALVGSSGAARVAEQAASASPGEPRPGQQAAPASPGEGRQWSQAAPASRDGARVGAGDGAGEA